MRATTYLLAVSLIAGSCLGQDLVPFAIPLELDLASPLWSSTGVPIDVNGPRLVVQDGHFWRAGRRVRLWGVNLSFAANFPTHKDAERIAIRMAAAGINAVRFHHMDTST
ncbi:MAG: hypothetical protein QHH07_12010, partial [Sedimentisphaerales bacterium]|nr:hypothetical protein [Sedimentisphaerales bacterium]